MSNYAVLHIQKGACQGGALGRHIDRRGEVKENVNKERSKHNGKVVIDSTEELRDGSRRYASRFHVEPPYKWQRKSLATKIDERIREGVTSKRALRSDAVRFLSVIMTYSPEHRFKDNAEFNKWLLRSVQYVTAVFGAENVVDITVHMDEKTPHIHATVVPITRDGRLSAKEVVGNRQRLTQLQDIYAAMMKDVGLERGHHYEKGEKVPKHEDINDWYSKVTLPADDAVKSLANALFEEDKKKAEEIARQLQAKRLAEAEKKALQEEQKYNSAPRFKIR